MNWKKWHRWVAIAATLPLIFIVMTGLLLQLRNQFEWIQPKSLTSDLEEGRPYLTFEQILSTHGDDKVDQIILRPGKRNLSLRMKDGMEVQIHPQTGEVQKESYRMTSQLIEFHQGSWLGPAGQYGFHFGAGLGLAFLIVSGIAIYPYKRRRE